MWLISFLLLLKVNYAQVQLGDLLVAHIDSAFLVLSLVATLIEYLIILLLQLFGLGPVLVCLF